MAEKEPPSELAPRDLERHIGQTVRKLRLQQNLTIAEIARKASISSGMLSKIENGQTSASLDSLAGLADALGTTLASIFSVGLTHPTRHYTRVRCASFLRSTA